MGVESAGDLQLAYARLFWRIGSKCCELLEGARNNDLTSTIAVSSGEPMRLGFCDDLIGVATQHSAHAGGGPGGCGRHCSATFTHEHHGLLGRENSASRSRGDFTDGMARACTNASECVSRMREELEERHQSSADQQGLRNSRIADGVSVGVCAVLDQVDFGHRGKPLQACSDLGHLQPWAEETWSL